MPVGTILLPIGIGLLGFVEPCTLGSTLVFVKFIEGKTPARKIGETASFMLTRALVIGLFGALAGVLGALFVGVQKDVWIALGGLYLALGLLYLAGRTGPLMVRLGPSLARLSGLRGSAGLGVLFGFNIPACAGPLILALLAAAAAHGAGSGGAVAAGFGSLALFGIALSLPLVTGLVFIVLGLWSIGFGLFVSIGPSLSG